MLSSSGALGILQSWTVSLSGCEQKIVRLDYGWALFVVPCSSCMWSGESILRPRAGFGELVVREKARKDLTTLKTTSQGACPSIWYYEWTVNHPGSNQLLISALVVFSMTTPCECPPITKFRAVSKSPVSVGDGITEFSCCLLTTTVMGTAVWPLNSLWVSHIFSSRPISGCSFDRGGMLSGKQSGARRKCLQCLCFSDWKPSMPCTDTGSAALFLSGII